MKVLLAIEPGDIGEGRYLTFGRWAICNDKDTDYGPFPFRIAYTSALLERDVPGIELEVIDPFIGRMTTSEFRDRVVGFRPDVMIMQVSPILWKQVMDLLASIKKDMDVWIVLCGNYPSSEPTRCLEESSAADVVMIGEFMETARDLIRAKIAARADLSGIPGIAWRRNSGEVVKTGRRPLMDIKSLPWPDRKRIKPEKYRNFTVYHPTYQMLMSMGCPSHCIYCVDRHVMYGCGDYRFRDPRDIVDEMQFLRDEMGARQVWFDDDSATAEPDMTLAFCAEKQKRMPDFPYGVMGDLMYSNDEVLRQLGRSKCIAFAFGVESMHPQILKNIGKPLDAEKVLHGVRELRRHGIISHATFSFGHPGETVETMETTFDFAKRLGADNAQFSIVTPYPGTPFYRQAEKQGWLIEKDMSKYFGNLNAVVSYPQLSNKQIEAAVVRFNAEWETIAARNRFRLALRHPLWAVAKVRHEGLRQALRLLLKATGL